MGQCPRNEITMNEIITKIDVLAETAIRDIESGMFDEMNMNNEELYNQVSKMTNQELERQVTEITGEHYLMYKRDELIDIVYGFAVQE